MKRVTHKARYAAYFVLLVALSVVPASAGSTPVCSPGLQSTWGDEAPLSGSSFLAYNLDLDSFPDVEVDPNTGMPVATGLHDKLEMGVREAANAWNQGCGGTLASRYPTITPAFGSSSSTIPVVTISFDPWRDETPTPCPNDPGRQCHAVGEAINNGGRLDIVIYRFSGPANAMVLTLEAFDDHLSNVLGHEIGHILGLEHNSCPGSFMSGDPLAAGHGEAIHSSECDLLQATHAPRNPLRDLLGDRDGALGYCQLNGYCEASGTPWTAIRNSCGWVLRTATLTHWNPITATLTVTEIPRFDYFCLSSWFFEALYGDPEPPPPISIEHYAGPNVVLAYPRPSETVSGMIEVGGWAWDGDVGLGDLQVWLDDQPIELSSFQQGFYSPELCDAGLDPGSCDPFSGFSGYLDTNALEPGSHTLYVGVVDARVDDPLPSGVKVEFSVGEPSSAPVAVEDEDWAVVDARVWVGVPTLIEVTANDYDPDGDAIRLTNEGVVVVPLNGMAVRYDDHHILYTPTPGAGFSDTFKYAIQDTDNLRARARVNVTIFYALSPI